MPNTLNDKLPLYIQVRNRLEDMIVKGQLNEGDQTPSTTQLAEFYKINHITVGKGVNQLVEEGVIYKKRGIGMFVAEGAREKLLSSRRKKFAADYVRPLLKEADKLDLSKEEVAQIFKEEIQLEGELE